MNKPKPEYGWRLLNDDEIILLDDKMWPAIGSRWNAQTWFNYLGRNWTPKAVRLEAGNSDYLLARRISPGEGWELVPENEIPGSECESTRDGITWHADVAATGTAGFFCETLGRIAFRRRPKSPQTGWVKCSERLPRKEEYPVWVCGADNQTAYSIYGRSEAMLGMPAGWPFSIGKSTGWDIGIWCWMRAVMPTPPPEPTPAEKAWDALTDKPADAKAAFIAGFEKGAAK